MKRKTIFFVLALLILMPFTAMASAPQVSCKAGTCSNLKVTKLTVNPSSKIAPAKIGFTGHISGPVKLVQYTVIDSKTGKVAGSSRSYCSRCTKTGICSCSCVISTPGTYDVKVTAYGSGNCCVNFVKKAAFTLAPSKLSAKESVKEPSKSSVNFVPSFKSTVSGKKVTFKDTSSGAKPLKWYWDFGDGYRSTAQNPSHVYKKAGTYKVCLNVYNSGSSCYKSVCNKVIVR